MSDYFQAMFRRRPNDGWFRAGNYDLTTTDILCGLALLTMLYYGFVGAFEFTTHLPFDSFEIRNLGVWRLLTWTFATPPDFFPLLGIIFFWIFGQQLEALFGRNRFLAWVLAVSIVPAAISALLPLLSSSLETGGYAFGLSRLFLCGIWIYAATYPGVKWFDVVPLWAVAAVFTLLDFLQLNGAGNSGQVVLLLVGVGFSLVAGRSLGMATGWPIPHVDLSAVGTGKRMSAKRRAPKQQRSKSADGSTVVKGPWKNAPAPTAPPVGPSVADQVELDSLLDKIGASGMDSLSAAEKKRLNELSKRLRNS